jgi:hypothetical protein
MPICEPESIDESLHPSQEERELAMEAAPAKRPRSHAWMIAALLAIACLVALLGAVILAPNGSATVAPARLQPMTLDFQAVQNQDHLFLGWNRAAKAVRDGTGATLSIHDGPESEDVALDLDTLRRGGVDYYPIFEDVSFRLTLTFAPGGSVSEQAHATLRP